MPLEVSLCKIIVSYRYIIKCIQTTGGITTTKQKKVEADLTTVISLYHGIPKDLSKKGSASTLACLSLKASQLCTMQGLSQLEAVHVCLGRTTLHACFTRAFAEQVFTLMQQLADSKAAAQEASDTHQQVANAEAKCMEQQRTAEALFGQVGGSFACACVVLITHAGCTFLDSKSGVAS